MKHRIQEIIDNQEKFKEETTIWIENDFKESKKILNNIEEVNEFIRKEKEFLIENIENINVKSFISTLFYLSKKRSEKFYAFWNEETQEAIIYKYVNTRRRNRKTPTRY